MIALKTPIGSPTDYLGYLRQILTSVLTSEGDKDLLKQALIHARRHSYWDELHLGSALLGLSSHLLETSSHELIPQQYPNGATLVETGGHWKEGALPDPLALAELGVLWGALGVLEKKRELCTALVKLASWQSHLLDHRGQLLQGIWTKSGHYPELLAYHSLLFSLAYALSGEEKFQKCAAAIRPYLKTIEIPELAREISKLLQSRAATPEKVHLSPFLEESVLGMAKAAGRTWTAIGSLGGYNTGLGGFHKDEAACITFGPLKRPLDDLAGFGIERPCSLSERVFSDVIWEKRHQGFRLKGWTKVFALSLWIETEISVQNGEMKISIQKEEGREWGDLAFAFFVRAEEAEVQGSKIKALSLSQFKGNAQRISFKGMMIEAGKEQTIEIIPLAGGDFFWGADLLVAFSLEDKRDLYEWIVK